MGSTEHCLPQKGSGIAQYVMLAWEKTGDWIRLVGVARLYIYLTIVGSSPSNVTLLGRHSLAISVIVLFY